MRQAFRPRQIEEEEESVFVSMTDMTVSFLFIVMILLAFFATQIVPGEKVPKKNLDERDAHIARLLEELKIYRAQDGSLLSKLQEENIQLKLQIRDLEQRMVTIGKELGVIGGGDLVKKISQLRAELNRLHELLTNSLGGNKIEQYNSTVLAQRAEILESLRARIASTDPTIDVSVSRNLDALQFKGDGLFASGASTPSRQGRVKMRLIAGILQDVIACFSFGEESTLAEFCNEHVAIIDALQIEGHADSDGSDVTNMDLSARRGASIYQEMVSKNPKLLSFINLRKQTVLSVAGYGEGRPIADEAVVGGKDSNRRIDIRFIMFSPADEESIPADIGDLERIRDILVNGEAR